MQHSFNDQEAFDYGDREAIVIWNLRFWIIKNKANNKHQYSGEDGIMRTWTYNTHEAFQKLFWYWTKDRTRRVLESLFEQEVIIKGNFNQNSYNKTCWYAFKDEAKFLSSERLFAHMANLPDRNGENAKSKWRNKQIDLADTQNGEGENAKSNTDIKLNIKTFLSLSDEEKKEKLKNLFKEKEYKSDYEKYFLFRQNQNWKGLSDLEADCAWWENGFKEKNPDKYIKKPTNAKTAQVEESPELIKIRSDIKFFVGNDDQLFDFYSLEKGSEGWKITANKAALKHQEVLSKINVKIEVK